MHHREYYQRNFLEKYLQNMTHIQNIDEKIIHTLFENVKHPLNEGNS